MKFICVCWAEQGVTRFYDQVIQAIIRHVNFDSKCDQLSFERFTPSEECFSLHKNFLREFTYWLHIFWEVNCRQKFCHLLNLWVFYLSISCASKIKINNTVRSCLSDFVTVVKGVLIASPGFVKVGAYGYLRYLQFVQLALKLMSRWLNICNNNKTFACVSG